MVLTWWPGVVVWGACAERQWCGRRRGTHNLAYGDTTCGSSFLEGEPQLGPLASNGGVTQTMALGAGSAALGAGDPAYCDGSPVDGFDQRGVARGTTQATCDIGAYQATSAASAPAARYVVLPSPEIAPPGSLSPGRTVAMSVSTTTAAGAPAPYVPVYLSLSGGIGSAAVNGTGLGPTPQVFISDASGDISVQYTAGTAPPGGGTDTLAVSDAAADPTLEGSDTYAYPQLTFISPGMTGQATSPVSATLGPIEIELEAAGSPVRTAAPIAVELTSSSTTGVFAATRGGAPITSLTIPIGGSSASFYYGDSATGTPTLTASAPT